jgi:hypothetical protein
MLRFLPLVLVGVLSALAAFAAGVTEDFPAIAQIVLVACLALFFGALLFGVAEGDRAN